MTTTNKPVIEYYTKHVYGKPKMYVTDEKWECIHTLTGRITLFPEHKQALEKLGFELKEVLPSRQLCTNHRINDPDCVQCNNVPR